MSGFMVILDPIILMCLALVSSASDTASSYLEAEALLKVNSILASLSFGVEAWPEG